MQVIWLVILQINPHTRKTFNKLYDNLFMLLKISFLSIKDVIVYCKALFAFVDEKCMIRHAQHIMGSKKDNRAQK